MNHHLPDPLIASRVKHIVEDVAMKFHRIFSNHASLIWFGSWPKGEARKQSDIDIAIRGLRSEDDDKVVQFQEYLHDYPTLYQFDLVDMRFANEKLINNIARHGQAL